MQATEWVKQFRGVFNPQAWLRSLLSEDWPSQTETRTAVFAALSDGSFLVQTELLMAAYESGNEAGRLAIANHLLLLKKPYDGLPIQSSLEWILGSLQPDALCAETLSSILL